MDKTLSFVILHFSVCNHAILIQAECISTAISIAVNRIFLFIFFFLECSFMVFHNASSFYMKVCSLCYHILPLPHNPKPWSRIPPSGYRLQFIQRTAGQKGVRTFRPPPKSFHVVLLSASWRLHWWQIATRRPVIPQGPNLSKLLCTSAIMACD